MFGSLPLSSYIIFVVTAVTADALLFLYDSQWNNTVPKDLFDALEQQRIEDNIDVHPVQDFFEPWTTQPGYPVINVTITNGIITVTQVSRSI
jgi:aminopeptidase N